jgi:kynurenine formamidase
VSTVEENGDQTVALEAGVRDPESGLLFFELSHEFGHYTPVLPGLKDIQIRRVATHAMHGVLTSHLVTVMHNGTHLNAPLHLAQRGLGVGDIPLDRLFANGVVLNVPKGEWEYIEPEDLMNAAPGVTKGDVVVINTGWHAGYSDSMEYFGHSPGLSAAAAQWLIDQDVTLVAIDTASIDHPLATSLAQGHRFVGPHVVELPRRYKKKTGRSVEEDFPEWMPAHRMLAAAGIPTIENVGADVDRVTSLRCTFHAMPWYWPQGDACIVRFVAIIDSEGDYRIERGL